MKTLTVQTIQDIKRGYVSSTVALVRYKQGDYTVTELSDFPVPVAVAPVPESPLEASGPASVARRMTPSALLAKEETGVGLIGPSAATAAAKAVAAAAPMGYLDSRGRFFLLVGGGSGDGGDAAEMHRVCSGIKQAIAGTSFFCLVTVSDCAVFVDGQTGQVVACEPMPHTRRIAWIGGDTFAVQRDAGLAVFDGGSRHHQLLWPDKHVVDVQAIHSRGGFAARTADGCVYLHDPCRAAAEAAAAAAAAAVTPPMLPDAAVAVDMVVTETATYILTECGYVYAAAHAHAHTDKWCWVKCTGIDQVKAIAGNRARAVAVHASGSLHWLQYSEEEDCRVDVCSIYGLHVQDVADVHASLYNWVLTMKDGTWFGMGKHIHTGPIVLGDSIKTVTNDGAHAFLMEKTGRVSVVGSAAHGGVNEEGKYGAILCDSVQDVVGHGRTFAAVLCGHRSVAVWGGGSACHTQQYPSTVRHVYMADAGPAGDRETVYVYTKDGKMYSKDMPVFDVCEFASPDSSIVAMASHGHDDTLYAAVLDPRHESNFNANACGLTTCPSTLVLGDETDTSTPPGTQPPPPSTATTTATATSTSTSASTTASTTGQTPPPTTTTVQQLPPLVGIPVCPDDDDDDDDDEYDDEYGDNDVFAPLPPVSTTKSAPPPRRTPPVSTRARTTKAAPTVAASFRSLEDAPTPPPLVAYISLGVACAVLLAGIVLYTSRSRRRGRSV
jgi:hypothetical protein